MESLREYESNFRAVQGQAPPSPCADQLRWEGRECEGDDERVSIEVGTKIVMGEKEALACPAMHSNKRARGRILLTLFARDKSSQLTRSHPLSAVG